MLPDCPAFQPEIPDNKQNIGQDKSHDGDGNAKIEIQVIKMEEATLVGFFKKNSYWNNDQKKYGNTDGNQMRIFFAEAKNGAPYAKCQEKRYEVKNCIC